jgi:demethylmenaquinone methyltransferase/2-methoxy-6-polyprenyl-1,4-benzoquinol methylase
VAERVGAGDNRILEVCGGTGYLARLVSKKWPGARVDVLDVSAESLAFGRRRAAAADLAGVSFVEAAGRPVDAANY